MPLVNHRFHRNADGDWHCAECGRCLRECADGRIEVIVEGSQGHTHLFVFEPTRDDVPPVWLRSVLEEVERGMG